MNKIKLDDMYSYNSMNGSVLFYILTYLRLTVVRSENLPARFTLDKFFTGMSFSSEKWEIMMPRFQKSGNIIKTANPSK